MKKKTLIPIAILAISILFSNCNTYSVSEQNQPDGPGGDNSKTITDLIDWGLSNVDCYDLRNQKTRAELLNEFADEIKQNGGPNIKFEELYYDYEMSATGENASLRDSELTRVRTEVMAGGGPDVFIVACDNGANLVQSEPLFKYPEQAMNRKLFLPLDNYVKNAQFMEWDKLTPIVMEAGRNEEGIQVITFNVHSTNNSIS